MCIFSRNSVVSELSTLSPDRLNEAIIEEERELDATENPRRPTRSEQFRAFQNGEEIRIRKIPEEEYGHGVAYLTYPQAAPGQKYILHLANLGYVSPDQVIRALRAFSFLDGRVDFCDQRNTYLLAEGAIGQYEITVGSQEIFAHILEHEPEKVGRFDGFIVGFRSLYNV